MQLQSGDGQKNYLRIPGKSGTHTIQHGFCVFKQYQNDLQSGMITIEIWLRDISLACSLQEIQRTCQSHYHCSICPGTDYAGSIVVEE